MKGVNKKMIWTKKGIHNNRLSQNIIVQLNRVQREKSPKQKKIIIEQNKQDNEKGDRMAMDNSIKQKKSTRHRRLE